MAWSAGCNPECGQGSLARSCRQPPWLPLLLRLDCRLWHHPGGFLERQRRRRRWQRGHLQVLSSVPWPKRGRGKYEREGSYDRREDRCEQSLLLPDLYKKNALKSSTTLCHPLRRQRVPCFRSFAIDHFSPRHMPLPWWFVFSL